jgi:hypothetical protein
MAMIDKLKPLISDYTSNQAPVSLINAVVKS